MEKKPTLEDIKRHSAVMALACLDDPNFDRRVLLNWIERAIPQLAIRASQGSNAANILLAEMEGRDA